MRALRKAEKGFQSLNRVFALSRQYSDFAKREIVPERTEFEKNDRRDILPSVPQPTALTHSHLLKSNEIAPGVAVSEFKKRREQLIKVMEDNSIAIISNAYPSASTNGSSHPFRSDSHFYYYTGCQDAGAILVLEKFAGAKPYKFTLFVTNNNVNFASQFFGAHEVLPLDQFEDKVAPKINVANKKVYYTHRDTYIGTSALINSMLDTKGRELLDMEMMHACSRVYKTKPEIETISKSAAIASEALTSAISAVKSGVSEYVAAAQFNYELGIRGAKPAFGTSVATHVNAGAKGYDHNLQVIKGNDLVTIEGGADYNMYVASVARTVPASGKFSPAQKRVYDELVNLHAHVISLCQSHGRMVTVGLYSAIVKGVFELLAKLQESGDVKNINIQQMRENLLTNNQLDETLLKFLIPSNPQECVPMLGLDAAEYPAVGYVDINGQGIVPLESNQIYSVGFRVYFPPEYTANKELAGNGFALRDVVLVNSMQPPSVLSSLPTTAEEIEQAWAKESPLFAYAKNAVKSTQ